MAPKYYTARITASDFSVTKIISHLRGSYRRASNLRVSESTYIGRSLITRHFF